MYEEPADPVHPKILPYVEKWADKKGKSLCKSDGSPFQVKHFREYFYLPDLKAICVVRELSPHNCRHTFATLLYRAGAEPLEVKKLMGHSRIEMSMHYTHTDMKRLQNAVNAL